jgi:peptide-methionine (R)-S-oxide reductase
VQRRTFLSKWLAAAAMARAAGVSGAPSVAELQRNWRSLLSPNAKVADGMELLKYSEERWKRLLTPSQYRVLREEETEPTFSSPLNNERRPGVYVCAACDLPLFSSAMKYDSGTGWPSFFTSIPSALETRRDFFLIFWTTEYHCARCGGHQGHLFNDGPEPTFERWCNNGIALRFIPAGA